MLENRVVRYSLYTVGGLIASELATYCFLYVRSWLRRSDEPPEVAEVIWTNELTQTCAGRHHCVQPPSSPSVSTSIGTSDGQNYGNREGVGGMEQNGRIVKLPTPTATPTCRNRYCAANNVGRLIARIDSAKYTIDLAMYTFTSYELAQALSRALRRGVSVRIISDKEMVYSSGSQIITLTKAGIPVRCPSTTMLMHHKFCILDGPMRATKFLSQSGKTYDKKKVQGIIMSGSLNWTMQGFGGNWENISICSNKTLVQRFEYEFTRMWLVFEHKMGPPIK